MAEFFGGSTSLGAAALVHPVTSTSYVPVGRDGFIDSGMKERENHIAAFVSFQ